MADLFDDVNQEDDAPSMIVALEREIHNLWGRMTDVRNSPEFSPESRDIELFRLLELHNLLDIEVQRQHELHMKEFIESLQLDEINAVPYIQGGIKCRVDQKLIGRKGRSISLNVKGVLERQDSFPGFANIKKLTPQTAKDIADMQTRRSEIIDELVLLERKKVKSPEDQIRLKQINDILKLQKERIRGV